MRQYVLSNLEVQKVVEENKRLKLKLLKYGDAEYDEVGQNNNADADLSYQKDLSKFDPYYGEKSKVYDRGQVMYKDLFKIVKMTTSLRKMITPISSITKQLIDMKTPLRLKRKLILIMAILMPQIIKLLIGMNLIMLIKWIKNLFKGIMKEKSFSKSQLHHQQRGIYD